MKDFKKLLKEINIEISSYVELITSTKDPYKILDEIEPLRHAIAYRDALEELLGMYYEE